MGSIRVVEKGSEIALLVPKNRFKELGLDKNSFYEISRARQNIWVLVKSEKPRENPLDKRIFSLIRERSLKERVEKRFESFLTEEEQARFKELLKEGEIVAFKLSPKYKRAVYKSREEIEKGRTKEAGEERAIETEKGRTKEPESRTPRETGAGKGNPKKKESEFPNAKEKAVDQYSLEKDGFLVCKNVHKAKMLSEKFKKEIEQGKIRGIKGFDGFFYIAEGALYSKHKGKVLGLIAAENGIGSAKIAEKAGIGKLLAKIVCELLKDEGEIIEKRKDKYQAI